ncbi:MAG: LytTR family DNA-binding domain-containing protein [Chitinophagaceae bacterium]
MNCIIVDDEPQARKLLQTYLSSVPGCTVTRVCRNAMEAYEALQTAETDLMFLDIKMPVISGTDFLRSLKNPPLVVFTTAYDKYALEGYELNVVDYLLKPVPMPRLLQAIDKAKNRLAEKSNSAPQAAADYTFVKQDQKLVKVSFRDIQYVEGMQNYIKIHLKDAVLIASCTMKAFEDLLPAQQFIRIHRSYIVALSAITAVKSNVVELPGIELPIGLSNKEQLMKAIGRGREA